MVPPVDSFGEIFAGEAAFAVGGDGWEGGHFGGSGGEDVAVGGEPVGGFFGLLFVLGGVSEVENLDFNAIGKQAVAGFEFFDGILTGPEEDA